MARLIDADALPKQKFLEANGNGMYEDVEIVYGIDIDNAPTIDAMPINRCKTCTFWDTEANEPDDLHNGLCTLNKIGTSDYFYCGAWTKDSHDFFNGDRDDWVSVVRCKDCKWKADTIGDSWCDFHEFTILSDDDFCSYGERKDNDIR